MTSLQNTPKEGDLIGRLLDMDTLEAECRAVKKMEIEEDARRSIVNEAYLLWKATTQADKAEKIFRRHFPDYFS